MSALNNSVLVLNKNYAAIKVASAKRAFYLLVKGVAEVVDVDENNKFFTYNFNTWRELSDFKAEFERDKYGWIQCVNGILAVPSIIRLTGYDKFRRSSVKLTRRNLFARDENCCQYCGKKCSTENLSLDHIVPKSQGGKLEWTNVVCACLRCNVKKSNRTPQEANMRLIRKPFKPTHPFAMPKTRHWSWKHFISDSYWNVELKD